MATLMRFQNTHDEGPLWINPLMVCYVKPIKINETAIYFPSGDYVFVREEAQAVVTRIMEAPAP